MTEPPTAIARRLASTASSLVDHEKEHSALPIALDALRADPNCQEALVAVARCHLALGHTIEASLAIDGALRLQPDDPTALRVRALCYSAAGNPERALQAVRRSIDLAPNAASGYAILADIQSKRGLIGPARVAAQKALELDPERLSTFDAIGRSELTAGSMRAARAAFREQLRRDPNGWTAHNNLGVVAVRTGNDVAALFHFARSVRIFPRQRPIDNLELTSVRAQTTALSLVTLAVALVSLACVTLHVGRWALIVVFAVSAALGGGIWYWFPAEIRVAMRRTRTKAIARSSWPGRYLAMRPMATKRGAVVMDHLGAVLSMAIGVAAVAVSFLQPQVATTAAVVITYVVGVPALVNVLVIVTRAMRPDGHLPAKAPKPLSFPRR